MVNITDYSNKQIGSGISLEKYQTNTDTTISLFGNGVNNYSLPLFENFIYLLSNFSNPFPPGSNFIDYYQANNNWLPSNDNIFNSKTILKGQLWFQSPLLPIMSDEIYSIVNTLVNTSNLSTTQISDLENQLITIYNNSTSFQSPGCLWVMNEQNNSKLTPLTYNLSGIGNIQVYDVSSLGWVKIYPNNIDSSNNLNLKNSNSKINFYTSNDLSTITSNITATGGVDQETTTGLLSLNAYNLNLNSNTINLNSNSGLISISSPNITVSSSNFTIDTSIPETDNSQKVATTAFVKSVLTDTVTSNGGEITGILTVPDPTVDNSKQVANAEYVNNQISKISNSSKTKIVSVLDYTDTDDITTAIQNMISKGLTYIYIPSGIYVISSNISLSENNIHLFGDGNGSIIIQDFDGDLFNITANNISISDLQLECSVSNRSTGSVFTCTQYSNIKLKDIIISPSQSSFFNGITFSSCIDVEITNVSIKQTNNYGINLSSCDSVIISSTKIEDCGMISSGLINGLTCDSTCSKIQIVNNFVGNSTSNQYQNFGIDILSNNNIVCSNNIFYNNKSGINIVSGSNVVNIGNIVN